MSKRKTLITEGAQPKPTAELRRESRLFRIAKTLASGAAVTEIAEVEGIGRTLASREANSTECRQLIAEFVGDEWDEMRAILTRLHSTRLHATATLRRQRQCLGHKCLGSPTPKWSC